MTIQPGQRIPEVPLKRIRDGIETVDTLDLFEGKKVLLFAVPGAFTPTCSELHLPSYIRHYPDFLHRGIEVYCTAVNDAFVMRAWARALDVPPGLQMLADGNGELAHALGLELDASASGLGIRSRRYALYAEDGVVKHLWVEQPGEFDVTSAESVLKALD